MAEDIQRMMELDAEDESLRKWKESILGAAAAGVPETDDERRLVVMNFGLKFPNGEHDPILREVDTEAKVEELARTPFVVREGITCRFFVEFMVNHSILSSLEFRNRFSKAAGLFRVSFNDMMGSFPPSAESHSYDSEEFEAPSGMMGRGTYRAVTNFVDVQGETHLTINYRFTVARDFEAEAEEVEVEGEEED